MGSNSSTPSETYHKEEVKENTRIFDCNTVLGVDLSKLEDFMDSIFSSEVPKDFQENMKSKIRVIRYSDKADNFKGTNNQTGLDSNKYECGDETHYFFFIAEKKGNKMDISYKFFVGKASIIKAYKEIKGKKILDDKKKYKEILEEVVDNPLSEKKQGLNLIKEELGKNLITERKNLLSN